MARLIGNDYGNSERVGIDMPNWHLNELQGGGEITAFADNSVTIRSGDHTFVINGTHFTYDVSGSHVAWTGGQVHGLTVYPLDNITPHPPADFTISHFSMSFDAFQGFVASDNKIGFQTALFSGADRMRGGACQDTLLGRGGDDFITGGDGDDRLFGAGADDTLAGNRGADYLKGGSGHDVFIYNGAYDSGGGVYDTLAYVGEDDRVAVPVTITEVDPEVDAGSSPTQNVEAALSAALDPAHLGNHHAVVVEIDVGPLGGGAIVHETFLIIDINGAAGYQSGQDIAIIVENPALYLHHIDADDFLHT